jgi:hypothetical protein
VFLVLLLSFLTIILKIGREQKYKKKKKEILTNRSDKEKRKKDCQSIRAVVVFFYLRGCFTEALPSLKRRRERE